MTEDSVKFSGRHFLLIMLGAFGVIIAVNLTLAYFALGSFPGLDVANTYVASQQFEARRRAQEKLGWQSRISYENGVLILSLLDRNGLPAKPQSLTLRVGSATTMREDRNLKPVPAGDGFAVPIELPAGNRVIFIDALAEDGTHFSERHSMVLR